MPDSSNPRMSTWKRVLMWIAITVAGAMIVELTTGLGTKGFLWAEDKIRGASAEVQAGSLPSQDGLGGWVSDQIINIFPSAMKSDFGFPGDDKAVKVPRQAPTGPHGEPSNGDYFATTFAFDLRGTSNDPIKVTSIEYVDFEQDAAPTGTLLYLLPQGDQRKGEFGIDLTYGADSNAHMLDQDGLLGDQYTNTNTVSLTKTEYVGFRVKAFAPENTDTRFRLRIHFDNGRNVVVDNNGKPFRIVTYPRTVDRAYTVTALRAGGTQGIYECRWTQGCLASYQSVLRNDFP